MHPRFFLALALGSVSLLHCAIKADDTSASSVAALSQPARDWQAHPAVVDLPAPVDLYAVSDVHGASILLRSLLRANHLIDATAAWTGGTATLLVAGDMIDKGDQSLEVIDLIRALESQATASGGRVVTTLGNHEAEFLANPLNSKATSTGMDKDGVDNELEADQIEPTSVADCTDTAGRGAWLASLPIAARVGDWFFAHAGSAATLSVPELEQSLERAVNGSGYSGVTGPDSIVEAKSWYGSADAPAAGKAQAAALGVTHIAFGHDPNALNESGRVKSSANGVLVKIDTTMGIHSGGSVGKAFLLHIHTDAKGEKVAVLDANGQSSSLP